MYEHFFGLKRRPFAATPDSACFFNGGSHQEALDALVICIERGQGVGILTAEPGMGKTLLCQRLATEVERQFQTVVLGNANFATRRSLLQAILFELGEDYSRRDEDELKLALRSRLHGLRPAKQGIALIFDEAHLVAPEALEEIRTLADISLDGEPVVRIVLSGQVNLEERLAEKGFDALNQRICCHVTLESLTSNEATEFLRYRLEWAGGNPARILGQQAEQFIARASGGIPRCINQLADHSLLLAFAAEETPVSGQTVRDALEDLKRLPLHWNDIHDLSDFARFQSDERPAASVSDSESSEEHGRAVVAHEDAGACEFESSARVVGGGSMSNQESVQAIFEFDSSLEHQTDPIVGGEFFIQSVNTSCERIEVVPDSGTEAARDAPCAASPQENSGNSPCSRREHRKAASADETPGVCIDIPPARRTRSVEAVQETPASDSFARPEKSLSAVLELIPTRVSDPSYATAAEIAECELQRSLANLVEPEQFDSSRLELAAVAALQSEIPVIQFEEEIVIDAYSVLQEPEFSGIIWSLAGRPVSQPGQPATSEDAQMADAADKNDEVEQSVCSTNCDSVGGAIEDAPIDELPCVMIEFGPTSHFEEVSLNAERWRDAADTVDESGDGRESVELREPHTSYEFHESDPSLSSESDTALDEPRIARPEHVIDGLIPLIDEIVDGGGAAPASERRGEGRHKADIEAELIESITTDMPDIEERIGAEVLDLCLDAQTAAQQFGGSTARPELADQSFSAVDHDNPESDCVSLSLHGYDVVEPEDEPQPSAPRSFRELELANSPEQDAASVTSGEPARRPFGRLFSELRRRQRTRGT